MTPQDQVFIERDSSQELTLWQVREKIIETIGWDPAVVAPVAGGWLGFRWLEDYHRWQRRER